VSWTFGDGSIKTGEDVSFTYDEVGQYAISVRLDGYVDPDEPDAVVPQEVREGAVTVCGPPEPEFTWSNKGGLRYSLKNESTIAPYCLGDSKWEVFRGRTTEGPPVMTFETWDPRFELPHEGPWLVRLTQTGLAGRSTADHLIQARYQLTDDLKGLPSYACSTSSSGTASGTASGAALGLLAALAARRSGRRGLRR